MIRSPPGLKIPIINWHHDKLWKCRFALALFICPSLRPLTLQLRPPSLTNTHESRVCFNEDGVDGSPRGGGGLPLQKAPTRNPKTLSVLCSTICFSNCLSFFFSLGIFQMPVVENLSWNCCRSLVLFCDGTEYGHSIYPFLLCSPTCRWPLSNQR